MKKVVYALQALAIMIVLPFILIADLNHTAAGPSNVVGTYVIARIYNVLSSLSKRDAPSLFVKIEPLKNEF